jgi:serine/threonine-protein kinase
MITRHQATQSHDAELFLAGIRAAGLLSPDVLDPLIAEPFRPFQDARGWAHDLVERGLLTGYQAEEILAGRGNALVLGQYRILDTLAAGGMGQVYKAEHALMGRTVALKVIAQSGLRNSESDREAFHREVRAAAQLTHPNIVTAFDAEEIDGVSFLVMEYVDGIDLKRLVRSVGPLPVRQACEYIRQAAVGLQYAFERGVLHCDVKPANLLVRADGAICRASTSDSLVASDLKLLDLGLARLLGSENETTPINEVVSGTVDFLAPEVARDPANRDVRSDLYSLGCTFYFLLTGRVPFPGATALEKIVRHQVDTPIPLSGQVPALPPRVIAIVEKLMARVPDSRFATPGEVAAELADWMTEGETPRSEAVSQATRTGQKHSILEASRGRPWLLFCGAGVLGGLILGLIVRQFWIRFAGEANAPQISVVRPNATAATFVIERTGDTYPNLTAVVNSAGDGDTIILHGDGPVATDPVILHEKSLTLRAADGQRPCLQFARQPEAFQSLLSSDRALRLEGIDLSTGPARCDEGVHLVHTEGGTLTLRDCHIVAPQLSAPLLVRRASGVEFSECRIQVAELALCVEVGFGSECAVVITKSSLETTRPGAAAVSIWGTEDAPSSPVRLTLRGNEFTGDRILALRDLHDAVEVLADDNRFDYRNALFTAVHLSREVTWHDSSSGPGKTGKLGPLRNATSSAGRPFR